MSFPGVPDSEGFPSSVTIDGFPLMAYLRDSKRFPVPGHSEWQQLSLTFPEYNLVGLMWITTQVVASASLYNRDSNQGNPPVRIHVNGQPYLLSPLSGFGCTNLNWLNAQTAAMGSNPMDGYVAKRIADERVDVKVTRYTGSSNMEFYHPVRIWSRAWGLSLQMARFLSRYRDIQDYRPRWWLGEYGVPMGFSRTAPPLAGWRGEWYENYTGFNAGDAQHYDLKELAVGYQLTGWPSFLQALINFWTFAEKNFASWQIRADQTYSGSIRTPGWMLTASALLYSALPKDDPLYQDLRSRVLEYTRWHLQNCMRFGILYSPYYYGSPGTDIIAAKKDYQFVYQVAVLMWGCLEVAARMPSLATDAKNYAETLGDWIEAHRDPVTGALGYVVTKDESIRHYGHGPGTVWWPMAPMTRFEARYGKHWGAQDVIRQGMQSLGWWNQRSFEGVELAAPALGFDYPGEEW